MMIGNLIIFSAYLLNDQHLPGSVQLYLGFYLPFHKPIHLPSLELILLAVYCFVSSFLFLLMAQNFRCCTTKSVCWLVRLCHPIEQSHIYIYAFSRRFYPKQLYIFFSMCFPWELNPQPFALLTLCSITEH